MHLLISVLNTFSLLSEVYQVNSYMNVKTKLIETRTDDPNKTDKILGLLIVYFEGFINSDTV